MSVDGPKPSKHTPAERDFLDSLSARQLMSFGTTCTLLSTSRPMRASSLTTNGSTLPFSRSFNFLGRNVTDAGLDASNALKTRPSDPSDLVPVKIEAPELPHLAGSALLPEEDSQLPELPHTLPAIKTRILDKGNREILELLSGSDVDPTDNSDIEVLEELTRTAPRSSSVLPTDIHDADDSDSDECYDSKAGGSGGATDNLTSFVRVSNFQLTKKVKAERIEEVHDPPSVWPMPRPHIPIVYVVHFDDPKLDITDPKLKIYALDMLIRNVGNDSWESSSGNGSSTAKVRFAPGELPVECRCARSTCKGAHAYSQVDPPLINVVRYELDPSSRNAVLPAQANMRRNEGITPEQHAAMSVLPPFI
ncbi:hypothetical protein C8R44DRAFT_726044 [Mycena epipterygia]|nr:hypothetical protein C8R44DRAFT_726044 [Mycena epipterygia]